MKVYIYTINFNGIPIYVGSTNSIKEREKSHCSKLCKEYKVDEPVSYKKALPEKIHNINQQLYKFLKDNNVPKIQLNVILEIENEIIIGEKVTDLSNYVDKIPYNIITKVNKNLEIELYHSSEIRYIEEDRIIKYCFSKGLKLFNLVYATPNKLGQHDKIEEYNIKKYK